jgi:hypothetical protein
MEARFIYAAIFLADNALYVSIETNICYYVYHLKKLGKERSYVKILCLK